MNKKLIELSEKVKRKQKLDVVLDDMMIEKDRIQGHIYDLEARLKQEEIDVVHLENFSLQGMWYTLLGRKEEQLEKEKQEVYDVQMQLASAENRLLIVKKEIERYEAELESLGDCEEEYRQELESRINSISQAGALNEDDRIVVLERLGAISGREKEIDEAVTAGNNALKIVADIKENLDSAKGWSVADILTDSLILTMIKRDKMDNAQDGVYRLQQALTHFKAELTDVEVDADINISTGDILDIADFWLDGVFIDWMVHDRITQAMDHVVKTENRINLVNRNLEKQKAELLKEKADLEKLL